jgi:prepilin-type N-terminal cleavage/methylation domain-containing protein
MNCVKNKMNNKLPIAEGQLPVAEQSGRAVSPLTAVGAHGVTRPTCSIANRKSKIANAFTLTELLVVISIIAVLAAFTFSALSSVKRHQYISNAQAELAQLQAAIDSYHAAYGFYPPGNGTNGMVNQLYYELEGTTNNGTVYTTLDGSSSINVGNVASAFSAVGGFVNCSKPGSGEDSAAAKNFIHELRPNQTGTVSNTPPTFGFTILTGSVGGPDPFYQPLGALGLNPWRYLSPGVNNPNSYDLWIQLSIGSRFSSINHFTSPKTYLICNWDKQVQINNPLP